MWHEKLISIGMVMGVLVVAGWSSATAEEKALAISIVTLTNPATTGERAKLTIQTEVGAMCLGNRFSESNSNERGKLSLKNVDREGKATWSWPVDPKSTKGRWALSLQCSTGKKKGSLSHTFEIR